MKIRYLLLGTAAVLPSFACDRAVEGNGSMTVEEIVRVAARSTPVSVVPYTASEGAPIPSPRPWGEEQVPRSGIDPRPNRFVGGLVPFRFQGGLVSDFLPMSSAFDEEERVEVFKLRKNYLSAMVVLRRLTAVEFFPAVDECDDADRAQGVCLDLRYSNGGGSFGGGTRLTSGGASAATLRHEFGHGFGLGHDSTRPDYEGIPEIFSNTTCWKINKTFGDLKDDSIYSLMSPAAPGVAATPWAAKGSIMSYGSETAHMFLSCFRQCTNVSCASTSSVRVPWGTDDGLNEQNFRDWSCATELATTGGGGEQSLVSPPWDIQGCGGDAPGQPERFADCTACRASGTPGKLQVVFERKGELEAEEELFIYGGRSLMPWDISMLNRMHSELSLNDFLVRDVATGVGVIGRDISTGDPATLGTTEQFAVGRGVVGQFNGDLYHDVFVGAAGGSTGGTLHARRTDSGLQTRAVPGAQPSLVQEHSSGYFELRRDKASLTQLQTDVGIRDSSGALVPNMFTNKGKNDALAELGRSDKWRRRMYSEVPDFYDHFEDFVEFDPIAQTLKLFSVEQREIQAGATVGSFREVDLICEAQFDVDYDGVTTYAPLPGEVQDTILAWNRISGGLLVLHVFARVAAQDGCFALVDAELLEWEYPEAPDISVVRMDSSGELRHPGLVLSSASSEPRRMTSYRVSTDGSLDRVNPFSLTPGAFTPPIPGPWMGEPAVLDYNGDGVDDMVRIGRTLDGEFFAVPLEGTGAPAGSLLFVGDSAGVTPLEGDFPPDFGFAAGLQVDAVNMPPADGRNDVLAGFDPVTLEVQLGPEQYCGNGIIEGDELCDGVDLPVGRTCVGEFGIPNGSLLCGAFCDELLSEACTF